MCYSEFVWGLRVVEKESERMEADNMRHSPLPQFFFSFFFVFLSLHLFALVDFFVFSSFWRMALWLFCCKVVSFVCPRVL